VCAALLGGTVLGGAMLTAGHRSAPVREPHRYPAVVQYTGPLAALDVLRGFDPPSQEYGAGHLGVDLRARQGQRVGAAAAATVQFAGQVAGRGVVVLLHPDGIRTEYEPLQPAVHAGERLAAGALIGSLLGRHRGCTVTCLHWGARRGDSYLDPLSLLRPLGPVVLLPDRP
jgi:murein DD-endopeptidase MepM/ murein hydrolase activator NlpD